MSTRLTVTRLAAMRKCPRHENILIYRTFPDLTNSESGV